MERTVRKSIRKELQVWADFYDRLLGSPSEEKVRKMDNALVKFLQGRWLGHKTEAHEFWLDRSDGTKLRLLIVMKKDHAHGVHEQDTGLLWLHGGGYMMGVPEMDFMFADSFCVNDNTVMVLPDYRKALEEPYPAALDDAMLALAWMKENAEMLGINPDQLFVGGESAGGGLTCALTLRARDEGKINIAFSMPLYPMISAEDTSTSKDNRLPVWNTAWNHLGWELYRGNLDYDEPYFSPSFETDYHDLPPAFTIVGDIEPFYAETKAYFDALYHAGAPVMIREYKGCFHAFDMTAPAARVAKKAGDLEQRTFQYAQAHFFKEQPEEKKNPLTKEERMIKTLHEAVNAQRAVLQNEKVLPEEEREDVLLNLQKIIEDDTADSLKNIEKLIDDMH